MVAAARLPHTRDQPHSSLNRVGGRFDAGRRTEVWLRRMNVRSGCISGTLMVHPTIGSRIYFGKSVSVTRDIDRLLQSLAGASPSARQAQYVEWRPPSKFA